MLSGILIVLQSALQLHFKVGGIEIQLTAAGTAIFVERALCPEYQLDEEHHFGFHARRLLVLEQGRFQLVAHPLPAAVLQEIVSKRALRGSFRFKGDAAAGAALQIPFPNQLDEAQLLHVEVHVVLALEQLGVQPLGHVNGVLHLGRSHRLPYALLILDGIRLRARFQPGHRLESLRHIQIALCQWTINFVEMFTGYHLIRTCHQIFHYQTIYVRLLGLKALHAMRPTSSLIAARRHLRQLCTSVGDR